MSDGIYRIYCSKCNKDKKRKMSWYKYLKYKALDGRSKGYQDISMDLVPDEPTKCIFGHDIDTNNTKIIFTD